MSFSKYLPFAFDHVSNLVKVSLMRVNKVTEAVLFANVHVFNSRIVFGSLGLTYVVQDGTVGLWYEPVVLGVAYQDSRFDLDNTKQFSLNI